MSIIDTWSGTASGYEKTANWGRQLSAGLFRQSLTISLIGELGAGKTVFAQGFAKGMGLTDKLVSPTFALEQRYGNVLSHIDLYRLGDRHLEGVLRHADDFHGIRLIEWADKAGTSLHADIIVTISEPHGSEATERRLEIEFRDIAIPSEQTIDALRKEVALPPHIIRHTEKVADVCRKIIDHVSKDHIVRREAVLAAAKLHDIFRFVDFPHWNGDDMFTPTHAERSIWQQLRDSFPGKHEEAGCAFLSSKGFPEIGRIIIAHRGEAASGERAAVTIEQRILAYADKRVRLDSVVTLEERFKTFMDKYAKDPKKVTSIRAWETAVEEIERSLFPSVPPCF